MDVESAPTTAAPAAAAALFPTLLPCFGLASGSSVSDGASVFPIRSASISRALSRSTAWPYSAIRSDCRMSACSSSGVSGAIRELGGISRVATTGVGRAPRVEYGDHRLADAQ